MLGRNGEDEDPGCFSARRDISGEGLRTGAAQVLGRVLRSPHGHVDDRRAELDGLGRRVVDVDAEAETGPCDLTASLRLDYAHTVVFFTFSDEGDEVSGSGSAELGEDDTLEIELSFHNGDDAV